MLWQTPPCHPQRIMVGNCMETNRSLSRRHSLQHRKSSYIYSSASTSKSGVPQIAASVKRMDLTAMIVVDAQTIENNVKMCLMTILMREINNKEEDDDHDDVADV